MVPVVIKEMESRTMLHLECPWCAGSVAVEIADGDAFHCPDCSVRVEFAPEPLEAPVAIAA
jgi:uncharacterized Zn finger protein (UPF0148 family)